MSGTGCPINNTGSSNINDNMVFDRAMLNALHNFYDRVTGNLAPLPGGMGHTLDRVPIHTLWTLPGHANQLTMHVAILIINSHSN